MDPFKMPSFDVPNEMRDFATKSMDQARRAFESFVGATHQAAQQVESAGETMRRQAADTTRQVVGFAEQNVKAAFDHAQNLAQAKGFDEVVKLQSDYLRDQIAAMQAQMKAMADTAASAAKPKK